MKALYKLNRAVALRYLTIFGLMITSQLSGNAQGKLTLLQNLKGLWSFSIGINNQWILPDFDDRNWETIKVPSPWENQGFNGYNGYAFYRKRITIPEAYKNRMLYLNMGYIDDVDEVYLNGHKIGASGGFPPHYYTAYNAERIYFIPESYIHFDQPNCIAVKVYDSYEAGGIVSGEIGLYGGMPSVPFAVNLQTTWKFEPGDDLRRKDPNFDDSMWNNVFVPARWEDQGFRDYDGFGWYRKSFVLPAGMDGNKMVIMLGKIDDIDQVYINGTLVGSTGTFPVRDGNWSITGQEYNALRGYFIPDGILKKGKENVVAVRVLDVGGNGGIYEGPVGILSQASYIDYWRNRKKTGY